MGLFPLQNSNMFFFVVGFGRRYKKDGKWGWGTMCKMVGLGREMLGVGGPCVKWLQNGSRDGRGTGDGDYV